MTWSDSDGTIFNYHELFLPSLIRLYNEHILQEHINQWVNLNGKINEDIFMHTDNEVDAKTWN